MSKNNYLSFSLFLCLFCEIQGKFMEGELKTSENWAFLARFCFLSEQGEYEYHIEYDEGQGEINLLLYYDANDQWPAVYKTNKSCKEKEAVLHAEQNQIINLTAGNSFRELSGCYYASLPIITTTQLPKTTRKYHRKYGTFRRRTQTSTKPSTTTARTTTYFEETSVYTSTEFMDTTTNTEIPSTRNKEEFLELTDITTHDVNQDFENVYYNITAGSVPSPIQSAEFEVPIKKRSLEDEPQKPKRKIVCHSARRFRSSRERWWFLAGIHIKYKILMTNGPPDDYWHNQFSADEFYVLPVLMAFTLAYSFLMLAIVMCSVELKSRQLLHSTYKLFLVSVSLQLFGVLLQSLAYLKYAINGIGFPRTKLAGSVFIAAAEICFLLLLLLLAKGYTVTRGRLPLSASVKLTVFMCLYVVTYASLFIYEENVFDPGEVLYIYESPAGYGLITLRVCAWCMFIYSTVFTLKHYPEKANFYYPFNIFGTLWFIAGPAFVLSANTYIDKWVRESVVCAVLLFIAFCGHLMFLLLTMPSVANKNFPYHVRTSQIGIMEITGASGSNTIEQFSHHVYEPSAAITETVIIPLTRRTEEIFENMYAQRMNSSLRIERASIRRNGNDNVASLKPQDEADNVMENVLNWSMARNIPALEARIDSSALGSANSRSTSSVHDDDLNLPKTESPRYNFDDYVRDVPVELFTVSKMVVSTTNLKFNDENSRT